MEFTESITGEVCKAYLNPHPPKGGVLAEVGLMPGVICYNKNVTALVQLIHIANTARNAFGHDFKIANSAEGFKRRAGKEIVKRLEDGMATPPGLVRGQPISPNQIKRSIQVFEGVERISIYKESLRRVQCVTEDMLKDLCYKDEEMYSMTANRLRGIPLGDLRLVIDSDRYRYRANIKLSNKRGWISRPVSTPVITLGTVPEVRGLAEASTGESVPRFDKLVMNPVIIELGIYVISR